MVHRSLRTGLAARAGHYGIAAAAGLLMLIGVSRAVPVTAQGPAPARTAATSSAAVLKQYCATCHSDRVKAGGLVLDPAGVSNVGAGAAQWEKVVRKLRAQAMPPPGAPRPDAVSYDRVASFLESELDRVETVTPHLGKLPLA